MVKKSKSKTAVAAANGANGSAGKSGRTKLAATFSTDYLIEFGLLVLELRNHPFNWAWAVARDQNLLPAAVAPLHQWLALEDDIDINTIARAVEVIPRDVGEADDKYEWRVAASIMAGIIDAASVRTKKEAKAEEEEAYEEERRVESRQRRAEAEREEAE